MMASIVSLIFVAVNIADSPGQNRVPVVADLIAEDELLHFLHRAGHASITLAMIGQRKPSTHQPFFKALHPPAVKGQFL